MRLKAAAGVVSLLGVATLATGATLHRDAGAAPARGDLGPARGVGGRTAGAQARIAFSSNGGVVLINADGSGREQLVDVGTGLGSLDYDSAPDWSPDGRTVAYARATSFTLGDQRAEIYLIGADGTGGRA